MNDPTDRPAFFASELGLRILSAIVLIIVVLFCAWVGGILFALVCAALSAVMFYEWERITSQTLFSGTEFALVAAFGVLIILCLFGMPVIGLIVLLAVGLVLELTNSGVERQEVRWLGLGALYCAIPVFALPIIREQGGFAMLLFVLLVVWVTDIAAYFCGRALQGPKLLPAVSPNKTWSGALGGLAGAVVVAILFEAVWPIFGTGAAITIAAALSVFSQEGDLFESWVKRLFGVKDSSNLIPGHGGFMDRVDGLVAAALPMAVMLLLAMP